MSSVPPPNLLHFTRIQAASHPPRAYVICLHGILGQGRNWTSIAQQYVDKNPGLGVLLVDLRLHGRSPAFSPPHTLEACAEDLHLLIEHLQVEVVGLMGHSFGGKVGLRYLFAHGSGLQRVWVLDSTPAPYASSGSVARIVQLMRALPMPQPSRGAAVEALMAHGLSEPIARWLATNLKADRRTFSWGVDLDGIEALMHDFYATDLWAVLENPSLDTDIHLVRAVNSTVLTPEACARAQAANRLNGRIHLHDLPDAGHWLHVDNPKGLLEILLSVPLQL